MPDWIASLLCSWLGLCVAAPATDGCRERAFEGQAHIVCSFDVADVRVGLHLDATDGRKLATLGALERSLPAAPLMLANGGMYHDDLNPVGLYIEDGRRRTRLSTKGGWGNFHLLPNGVFWGRADGTVGVTETKAFARRFGANGKGLSFATQSGPMLVIGGRLHPRFLRDSDSRKVRNGVGVSKDGRRLHFAQSKRAVTFHHFGRLFRDELATPNALFLDGTVSSVRAPGVRREGWKPLGPMIAVTAR